MSGPSRYAFGLDRRTFVAGALAVVATPPPATAKRSRAEPLIDARVARASGDIVEAELIGATQRYDHFVLGSRHEASGLRVRAADGRSLELQLPADSVFEDREPRILDLDGDGRSEIALVRSRISSGSALALLGLRDGAIRILAETPTNGGPYRWLNPAGVGRFASGEKRQIAIVRMPHVVGKLEFWEFDGATLILRSALDGVSNHRIGSANLHMSAVIGGVGGGGVDLLALPSLDRRALLLVEARTPEAKVVGRAALPARADGNFGLDGSGVDARLTVPLDDGTSRQFAVAKLLAGG